MGFSRILLIHTITISWLPFGFWFVFLFAEKQRWAALPPFLRMIGIHLTKTTPIQNRKWAKYEYMERSFCFSLDCTRFSTNVEYCLSHNVWIKSLFFHGMTKIFTSQLFSHYIRDFSNENGKLFFNCKKIILITINWEKIRIYMIQLLYMSTACDSIWFLVHVIYRYVRIMNIQEKHGFQAQKLRRNG